MQLNVSKWRTQCAKVQESFVFAIIKCKVYISRAQGEQYMRTVSGDRGKLWVAASTTVDARENRLAVRRQQSADRCEVEMLFLRRV